DRLTLIAAAGATKPRSTAHGARTAISRSRGRTSSSPTWKRFSGGRLVPDTPTFLVAPGSYRNLAGEWVAAADPIGSAIRSSLSGCLLDLIPGGFPRAKGPFGAKNVHIRGWDRSLGISTILRDDAVGSSDDFILGDGDTNFVIERLNIELDDRAGVKTTS